MLQTLELFRQYREAVDSIIMLRAFRHGRDALPTKYQLLEIHGSLRLAGNHSIIGVRGRWPNS